MIFSFIEPYVFLKCTLIKLFVYDIILRLRDGRHIIGYLSIYLFIFIYSIYLIDIGLKVKSL